MKYIIVFCSLVAASGDARSLPSNAQNAIKQLPERATHAGFSGGPLDAGFRFF